MNGRFTRIVTVIISATFAASAFLLPTYCCWFVFIFLIPLFHFGITQKVSYSFRDGVLWGIIFFGLHMHGLLRVIMDRAYGRGGATSWFLFILYCSVYAGLWFWGATLLASRFKSNGAWLGCWIVATFWFFWWLDNGLLVIAGCFEGYPLSQLLLPLISYPKLLYLLPYCGSSILIIFLLLWSGFISYFFVSLKGSYLAAATLCLLPFYVGWLSKGYDVQMPDYLKNIVVVAPASKSNCPLDVAQDIAEQLTMCIEKNRNVNIIIMPESSYPFPLNEYEDMIQLWSDSVLSDKIMLIIGAHRREAGRLFNTLYCIQSCRITQYYDKKHIIPLIEYLPPHFNVIPLNTLFLHNKEKFNVSQLPRHTLNIREDLTMMPYICSELFFAKQGPEERDIPILCVANDTWFSAHSMRRLLYLVARYKAVEWQNNILYASHYGAHWFDKNGRFVRLKRL